MPLILFDCDGTLVDSQNAIVAAMDRAFVGAGLEAPTRAETLGVVGLSLPEAFAVLAPELDAATHTRLQALFRNAGQAHRRAGEAADPLFPGAAEAVSAFRRREDFTLGLATGKSIRGVERVLSRYGWKDAFATIQTADTNPSKPSPVMIQKAMAELGVEPHQTIMIGDTTYDIEMAVAAGVAAIAVDWGYHPAAALRQAGADTVIAAFTELEPTIESLLQRRRKR